MRINWLGTTAVALLIGTGAVVAQQPDQKREEAPRAQTPSASSPSAPSKDAEHPGAGEQRPADRMKDRTTRSEPKAGAKEPQRGEAASPSERKQAQEQSQGRDSKQPTKQSQEQPSRGERPPATQTQQSQDEQKGRDGRQPAEPKEQQGRSEQPKQDNRAVDERRPADTKQQQGQRQPDSSTTQSPSAQQSTRPGDTSRDRQQQGQNSGQRPDQSAGRTGTSSVTANDDQRRQIAERLHRERTASNENINIRVNVGERLPPRVRPRPLPPDIVQIAPQYRDYEYTVINDEIAIVDPRSREVVDIIDDTGAAGGRMTSRRDRVVITREQRDLLKQVARRTVGSASSSGSVSDSSCLQLQPMPDELTRNNLELSQYRYLAIGDEVVLVDPRQQKIVQVID
jgi:hypothetical protein